MAAWVGGVFIIGLLIAIGYVVIGLYRICVLGH